MKQKQMTAIAVACGVVCAACVALFMMSVQGEADAARAEALARYGGEQVEAYVATRDIVAGERVDLSAVETKLWVAGLLPENAVRSSAEAVGKTATSAIFKGEVITSGRFEAERDSLDVPAGKQAVSVPAKAVQAVGGAISPGMSVDIYASGDASTVALAQNVSVLDTSVGNSGGLTSSDNGWVTLAVDPGKVEELIAASNRTTLYFTLPGAAAPDGGAIQDGASAGGGSSGGSSGGGSDGQGGSEGSGASSAGGDSADLPAAASGSRASGSASAASGSRAEGSAGASGGQPGGSAAASKKKSGGER